MKDIIRAGRLGTRSHSLANTINELLLPLYEGPGLFLMKIPGRSDYEVAGFNGQNPRRVRVNPNRILSNHTDVRFNIIDNSVSDLASIPELNNLKIDNVNNIYLKNGRQMYAELNGKGADAAGSPETHNNANAIAGQMVEKEGRYFIRGAISKNN